MASVSRGERETAAVQKKTRPDRERNQTGDRHARDRARAGQGRAGSDRLVLPVLPPVPGALPQQPEQQIGIYTQDDDTNTGRTNKQTKKQTNQQPQ